MERFEKLSLGGLGKPEGLRAGDEQLSLANRSKASCDSHTSTSRHPPSEVGPHTWTTTPSGGALRAMSWANCSYCSRVTPGNSRKTPTAISAFSFPPLSQVGTTSTAYVCIGRCQKHQAQGIWLLKRVR